MTTATKGRKAKTAKQSDEPLDADTTGEMDLRDDEPEDEAAPKAPSGQLGDWLDKIPESVASAAESYDKAHSKAQKAKGELNTAKENLIEKMIETGCKRCPIRNGEKFLELQEREAVKYAKPKENPAHAINGDGAGETVTMKRIKGGRMVNVRTPAKAAVTPGDKNAAADLAILKNYGIPVKKIDTIRAACGGNSIGHFEVWMNGNQWWHRDLKGFGEQWITTLQDAHFKFRKDYPVLAPEESDAESDAGTVLDPAVAGAE